MVERYNIIKKFGRYSIEYKNKKGDSIIIKKHGKIIFFDDVEEAKIEAERISILRHGIYDKVEISLEKIKKLECAE